MKKVLASLAVFGLALGAGAGVATATSAPAHHTFKVTDKHYSTGEFNEYLFVTIDGVRYKCKNPTTGFVFTSTYFSESWSKSNCPKG